MLIGSVIVLTYFNLDYTDEITLQHIAKIPWAVTSKPSLQAPL